MDTSHGIEFANRIVGLAEVFDAKLSAQRIALYFEALRDVDFERVVYALNQCVKTCKFMPRPAEIRALALGDAEDRAEAAWLAFRGAMRRAGSYASVSIRDAALGETIVAMFGTWPAACASEFTPEMWSAKRKEFGRVYRVMCDRNYEGARYLLGTVEATNANLPGDWAHLTQVYRIGADGQPARLTTQEAERERQQIGALSNGLSAMSDVAKSALSRIVGRHAMDEAS